MNRRTEGWISGLHLAALSLRDTVDVSQAVHAFAGSHRFLTDYLMDEVLSQQPAALQSFLRRTSILERFNLDLCDALVEDSDNRPILRQLEQTNLFLVPLDGQRNWYRYHHLFAEFLRLRLYEHEPDLVPELYRRAIDWCNRSDLPREALHYALETKDHERATDIIERLAPDVLAHDNHMLVIEWIESLPPDLVKERAFLCAYLGWAWAIAAKTETASQWLDRAESLSNQLAPHDARIIQGHVEAHRAYIIFLRGEYQAAIPLAQRALDSLPHHESATRGRTITCLGNAYNYCGKLQEAKESFKLAIGIAKEIGSLSLAMFSYGGLGEVLREEGHLTQALGAYQQLLHLAKDLTGRADGPLTGFAHFEIGVIYREWHQLDSAIDLIQKGVGLCQEWQQGEPLIIGLLELAETHRIRGEYAHAKSVLDQARHVASAISPWATNLVEAFFARLALSQSDLETVAHWAERSGLTEPACDIGYERFPECPPLIRMYIATGNPQRALVLIEQLIERDQTLGRWGRVLDLLVLKVAALDATNEPDRARAVLVEAAEMAAPEKHLRPFVDLGPTLIPYLQDVSFSNHKWILSALEPATQSEADPVAPQRALVEPLTDREIAILRRMSAGLSNKEIAGALYLSVNTIRWYASQIYSKLSVRRRGEAVARARELDLI